MKNGHYNMNKPVRIRFDDYGKPREVCACEQPQGRFYAFCYGPNKSPEDFILIYTGGNHKKHINAAVERTKYILNYEIIEPVVFDN